MGQKKIIFLWILLPIFVVGLFLFFATHYLADPTLFQEALKKTLSDHLQGEVSFEKAKLTLWGGIGILFEHFRIKDPSATFELFETQRLIVNFRVLPLLKKEIKWKRILLDRPLFRIVRNREGEVNLFHLPLKREKVEGPHQRWVQILASLSGGSLTIQNGEVSFLDEGLNDTTPFFKIQSFQLRLSRVSFQKPFPFQLRGKLLHGSREGHFSISGMIESLPPEMVLSKGKMRAEVELQGIDVSHFWPYLKGFLPMEKIAGILHLSGSFQGELTGPFKAKARMQFKEVTYEHSKVFAYSFHPPWVNIEVAAEYDQTNFNVSQISVELPEMKVKGKGVIYGIGTGEMGLKAEAQSSPFEIMEGRKFIPFRIITPKVSDPLFRGEGSGLAQILSVRLSGKISEIDQCDQLKNAHVLSIEMKVQKARLKLPWDLPPLEGMRAHLLFKEGHLLVKEAEGRFLHSWIDRAQGTFYELLQVPTLEMDWEGRFDLTDLLSLSKFQPFSEGFPKELSSITSLSGKANYRVHFKGRLTSPLSFEHQGNYQLTRVRMTHSQVPFPILMEGGEITLSNTRLQWSGTKVTFGGSSLWMDGLWEEKRKLEVSGSGRVDLKNLLQLFQCPLFPENVRLKSKEFEGFSGVGDLSIKFKRLDLKGLPFYEIEFRPQGVSFSLLRAPHPILFREGGISFSPSRIHFSKLKIRYENDSILMDGKMEGDRLDLLTSGQVHLKNLKDLLRFPLLPESLKFSMNDFDLMDGIAQIRLQWKGERGRGEALPIGSIRFREVSFQHRGLPLPLSSGEGNIFFTPQQIRIEEGRAKLGEFPFTLSLSCSRSHLKEVESTSQGGSLKREIGFTFYSPRFDLDLLFPKKEGEERLSFLRFKEWLSHWTIHGKVNIEEGRFRGLPFREFKAEMKTMDEKLFVHPFQLKSNGGTFSTSGWIEPSAQGVKFELHPRLYDLEVQRFLQILFEKREKVLLSGMLTMDPFQIRGEGENFQKIKESLNGELKLTLEKGVIERGNILAKIFSLLNVSQLFKGRVPDLKTRGLPYRWITATIRVRDGVAFTEDLLVESDAMRITAIGKVDLGKNLIDARVGIHPLITVDTLISHIPIAGYILTGKDKAFLSYFYEVKGELDDPKVEAIPFKSMGEGFLGMVKRLLETPLRPFQRSKGKE
jgi:hypothetical protein